MKAGLSSITKNAAIFKFSHGGGRVHMYATGLPTPIEGSRPSRKEN